MMLAFLNIQKHEKLQQDPKMFEQFPKQDIFFLLSVSFLAVTY